MILYLLTEEGAREAAHLRALRKSLDDEGTNSEEAARIYIALGKRAAEFQAAASEYRDRYARASHMDKLRGNTWDS